MSVLFNSKQDSSSASSKDVSPSSAQPKVVSRISARMLCEQIHASHICPPMSAGRETPRQQSRHLTRWVAQHKLACQCMQLGVPKDAFP
mmetsp:Transcript_37471/g.88015  ORF Transcript_37471/g.88015 Transcript_37471/m.88015 type:complete len:89 (+) Transcript_37471:184-450(+)